MLSLLADTWRAAFWSCSGFCERPDLSAHADLAEVFRGQSYRAGTLSSPGPFALRHRSDRSHPGRNRRIDCPKTRLPGTAACRYGGSAVHRRSLKGDTIMLRSSRIVLCAAVALGMALAAPSFAQGDAQAQVSRAQE